MESLYLSFLESVLEVLDFLIPLCRSPQRQKTTSLDTRAGAEGGRWRPCQGKGDEETAGGGGGIRGSRSAPLSNPAMGLQEKTVSAD